MVSPRALAQPEPDAGAAAETTAPSVEVTPSIAPPATTAPPAVQAPAPPPPAPASSPAPPEETGFGVAPFVVPAYQDETSFLLGAAAVAFYRQPEAAHRRESQVLLAGAASLRKQFTGLLSPDLYLADDRFHVGGTISAARFPDRFFGVESRERLSAEERYTPIYVEIEASPKIRVLRNHYVYVGPSIRYQYADITERADGGLLARRTVTGADGGSTFQLGARAFWDARDNTLYPTRGTFTEIGFLASDTKVASDFSFTRTRLDAKQYISAFFPRHVLGLQEVVELRTGDAPFYDLGKLGGSRLLRGHFEGKHRDAQLAAVQVEYRLPLFWRIGAVAFGGAGVVAPSVSAFDRAKVYASGGGGLRFAPSKKAPVNIRL
ncbi:MAG: BamA/TamA family outer membrane protein, partial [Myxococcales bacterium]|nr:BamA/TamA family outer membrane protein [Myxococcales bacterium]